MPVEFGWYLHVKGDPPTARMVSQLKAVAWGQPAEVAAGWQYDIWSLLPAGVRPLPKISSTKRLDVIKGSVYQGIGAKTNLTRAEAVPVVDAWVEAVRLRLGGRCEVEYIFSNEYAFFFFPPSPPRSPRVHQGPPGLGGRSGRAASAPAATAAPSPPRTRTRSQLMNFGMSAVADASSPLPQRPASELMFFGGKTRRFRGEKVNLDMSTIVPNDLKIDYYVTKTPVRERTQSCVRRTAEKYSVCGGRYKPGQLTQYLLDLSEKLYGYNEWNYFQQIDAVHDAVKRHLVDRTNIDDLLPLVTQCIEAREAVIQDCYSGETDASHLHVLEQLKSFRTTLQEATAGNRWARSLVRDAGGGGIYGRRRISAAADRLEIYRPLVQKQSQTL